MTEHELIRKLERALAQHSTFVGLCKANLGFTRPAADISGNRPSLGAKACDELILNYPDDPFELLEKARKFLEESGEPERN